MNDSIHAIFENGVIRPLERVELSNGEEIEVILLRRANPTAEASKSIISRIAAIPIEGETDYFSGELHDEILYPAESK